MAGEREIGVYSVKLLPESEARRIGGLATLSNTERDFAEATADLRNAQVQRAKAAQELGQSIPPSPEEVALQQRLQKGSSSIARAARQLSVPSTEERLDLTDQVTSFSFEDNERKLDKLVLSVDNFDLRNFDDPVWRKGGLLEFSFGYPGNLSPPRQAIIKKVTGFQTLNIEAHGRAALMDRVPQFRTFENMSRAAVIRSIAQENGFTDDTIDIDETSVVFPTITQARLTDAKFIKKLALREHFEFYVDANGFHWHQRRLDQRPLRTLTYYHDPGRGDILGINVENDVTARPGKIRLRGRDPLKKKDIDATGSNDDARPTLAPVVEVVDPITGQVTRESRSASEETRTTSEENEESAKRQAKGKFRKVQEATVKLTVDMVGDPLIAAKRIVRIEGIGNRLSGPYYTKVVTHKIDSSGYTTNFKSARDGHGGYAAKINAETKGTENKKKSAKQGQVEAVEVVDPITGQTSTQYHESKEISK